MKEKIIQLIGKLRSIERSAHTPEKIDFRTLTIPYVAKGDQDSAADAAIFGDSIEKYRFWRPHMCAVCCLKMAGDAAHKTEGMTLSALVDTCMKEQVFLVDGETVRGAFHFPLARVLLKLGIPAQVAGRISIDDMIREIGSGKIIFLSVDLSRLRERPHNESHMVVVYAVSDSGEDFLLHDCSSILSENGNATPIPKDELARLSNMKGLIVG